MDTARALSIAGKLPGQGLESVGLFSHGYCGRVIEWIRRLHFAAIFQSPTTADKAMLYCGTEGVAFSADNSFNTVFSGLKPSCSAKFHFPG